MTKAERKEQADRLVWYFDRLTDEGREVLLKIARSFIATGTFASIPDLSKDLKAHLDQMESAFNARIEEDF